MLDIFSAFISADFLLTNLSLLTVLGAPSGWGVAATDGLCLPAVVATGGKHDPGSFCAAVLQQSSPKVPRHVSATVCRQLHCGCYRAVHSRRSGQWEAAAEESIGGYHFMGESRLYCFLVSAYYWIHHLKVPS